MLNKIRAALIALFTLIGLAAVASPASAGDVIWTGTSAHETVLPPFCGPECERIKAEKAKAAADWEGPCSTTSGILCPYDWSDGLFPLDTMSSGVARNTCFTLKLNGTNSNATSSFWNRTNFRWWVFRTGTCGGAHKDIPPNAKLNDLRLNWGTGWDGPIAVMRTSGTTKSEAAAVKTVPIALAAPPQTCANGSVCGYVKYNFNTEEGYEYIPSHTAGFCETMVGLRNQWTSLYNNTGRRIRVYDNTFCGGDYVEYASGGSSANLAFSHPTHNDDFESVKFF